MEINEIKKFLYKDNPAAFFRGIKKGTMYYEVPAQFGKEAIRFHIPIDDLGGAEFSEIMESKLLIRYLYGGKGEIIKESPGNAL